MNTDKTNAVIQQLRSTLKTFEGQLNDLEIEFEKFTKMNELNQRFQALMGEFKQLNGVVDVNSPNDVTLPNYVTNLTNPADNKIGGDDQKNYEPAKASTKAEDLIQGDPLFDKLRKRDYMNPSSQNINPKLEAKKEENVQAILRLLHDIDPLMKVWTPRAKQMLEYSVRETLSRDDQYERYCAQLCWYDKRKIRILPNQQEQMNESLSIIEQHNPKLAVYSHKDWILAAIYTFAMDSEFRKKIIKRSNLYLRQQDIVDIDVRTAKRENRFNTEANRVVLHVSKLAIDRWEEYFSKAFFPKKTSANTKSNKQASIKFHNRLLAFTIFFLEFVAVECPANAEIYMNNCLFRYFPANRRRKK